MVGAFERPTACEPWGTVMSELNELLGQTLESAAHGLFEHLGVDAFIGEATENLKHDIACSVGFASPTLRGSLTLTADQAFVTACRPPEVRGAEATAADISDWMGELGNQLLGRFKNRLISYGVVVELGTPAVLYGFQIQRHSGRMPIACQRLVRSQHGTLSVHIDAHASPDFQMQEVQSEDQAMPEGELALF